MGNDRSDEVKPAPDAGGSKRPGPLTTPKISQRYDDLEEVTQVPGLDPASEPATPFAPTDEAEREADIPPKPARLDLPDAIPANWSTTPSAPPPAPKVPAGHRDAALELLWFDRDFVAEIRAHEPWKAHRPDVEPAPIDRKKMSARTSQASSSARADDVKRLDVTAVLAGASPSRLSQLERMLFASRDATGGLTPPLVLAEGQLVPSFDEVAELEMAIAMAKTMTGRHKALAKAIDVADKTMETPFRRSPATVQHLVGQLAQAWAEATDNPVPSELPTKVGALLTRERRYRQRELLDDELIRAVLHTTDERAVVYLPDAMRRRLPLFRSFRARLIAEVIPRQDEDELATVALRARAVARFVHPAPGPAPASTTLPHQARNT